MNEAVRAFTTGIIDYAGLFPPEKLPLAEALASFASYQRHTQAHFLARFVLPMGSFPQAAPLLTAPFAEIRAGARPPWVFSALAKAQETSKALHAALPAELGAVRAFLAENSDVARVDCVELALPLEACVSAEVARSEATRFLEVIAAALPGAAVHFEIPWKAPVAEVLKGLARVGGENVGPRARAKFRTGGLTPETIPPAEAVRDALLAAVDCGVASKFTAGLHEPVRHPDAAVGATLHGFLNVFLACYFARFAGWGAEGILGLLLETDGAAFEAVPGGIAYRGQVLGAEEIRRGREEVATSFGTCSFLEPVEGLRRLNFIP